MPKSIKSPAPENGGMAEMPFEAALKRLEAIVEAMESEDLPLESLLARFEEGTRLTQVCQAKLAEAEVKIQQLEQDGAGELALKPLPTENRAE
jgi:exodeoxyribonuclease VII small subunit